MDTELEKGKAVAQNTFGYQPRRSASARRGRRPAPSPEGSVALDALLELTDDRFSCINKEFRSIKDPRDASRILYSAPTLLWTLLLGFIGRCGSRNAMDGTRNEGHYAQTVLAFSKQRAWPDGEPLTTACTETACSFLDHIAPEILEGLLVTLVRQLIRAKALDWARVFGYFMIAVDGTKQENCRAGYSVDGKSMRMVLEAKLIGPNGLALPILVEPLDQYDNEREKHDCEQRAFKRIAPRLKEAFPKLLICLSGDALYASEPVFEICERYNWKFMLTFKDGSHPAVAQEAQALLKLQKENMHTIEEEGSQIYLRWVQAVPFPNQDLQVVFCKQTGENSYTGAWVTNFLVEDAETAATVAQGSRRRWNIESSFNVQKHGGFGLEHTFCTSDKRAANMHLLMQLAHLVWQIVYLGILRRVFAKCRKLSQITIALLIRQAMHAIGARETPDKRYQLRFSSA